MPWWETIDLYWHEVTAWGALLILVIEIVTVGWVLTIKKEPTSALAWCLVVIFVPILGVLLFVLFGYQHVHRPMARIAQHRQRFRLTHVPSAVDRHSGHEEPPIPESPWVDIGRLAQKFDAQPMTAGNALAFYYEGRPAFDAMLEAMAGAKHHIHLEFFIFHPAGIGRKVLDLLSRKAREGVAVRLLYDAIGSRRFYRWSHQELRAAGGRVCAFLPVNPLRRRIQINLRNHRKLLIVDGRTAFTGGLNVGDEYLGLDPGFGPWRDTHLRVRGPAALGLQRIFVEDWDFAAGEHLRGADYYPAATTHPAAPEAHEFEGIAQVIHSGPDQALKSIREIYFAAILRARQRLWIATPYFLPDAGLLDALCLAGRMGVDVRLLGQYQPDKWTPYFAGRYFWAQVLEAGVKVYQYTPGMMHAKTILVDGQWSSVGSANLDNRSMHLNFEANLLIYSPTAVADLEAAFLRDLSESIRLDRRVFARRPFPGRLIENACRLLSPIL